MRKRRTAWLLLILLMFSIRGEADIKAPLPPAIQSQSSLKALGTVSGGAEAEIGGKESVSGGVETEINSELSTFLGMDEQKRASMVTALYAVPVGRGLYSPEETDTAPEETGESSAETAEPEATEPEATKPEATEAETAEPETAEPETAEPEDPLHALGDNPYKQAVLFGPEGGRYTSGEEAASHMENVEVPVWELNGEGQRTTGTMWVQVNAALAEDIREIFTEIYEDAEQFPVESMGGFVWRDSNPASEHCSGTAIDINPDQNFQVRDGNAMTGSFWKPGEDPRSITPEGSVVRAFAAHGWSWGGDAWAGYSDQSTGYHDYMHFSYMGR